MHFNDCHEVHLDPVSPGHGIEKLSNIVDHGRSFREDGSVPHSVVALPLSSSVIWVKIHILISTWLWPNQPTSLCLNLLIVNAGKVAHLMGAPVIFKGNIL